MRVLITGVAGFVGSAIAQKSLDRGDEVIGIDSLSDYYSTEMKRSRLEAFQPKIAKLLLADLNKIDLDAALDGVDVVYHQAGQPGVRKSWGNDFNVYLDSNISATQRLLEACARRPIAPRVIYASSSSIYGDAEKFPTTERVLPSPKSPYGVTKLAAEHLCVLYASNFGVPTVSLRYFTVYGPGQRPDMAFTRFCAAALTGGEIRIFGDGGQVRDFTYIDDVVAANIAAGTSVESYHGAVFNVSGGSNVSVNDVLAELTGISQASLNIVHMAPVPGDVRRTGGSTALIKSQLGWESRTTLHDGLERQFHWVEDNLAQISTAIAGVK